uniref:Uncharacterized protein n=1 Tax=viral metagenome TaxID=1070528 RepID=A0A6C0CAP2_9ZZZZ
MDMAWDAVLKSEDPVVVDCIRKYYAQQRRLRIIFNYYHN